MISDTTTASTEEPIAIVGIACRLPGGITTLDGLWDALARGKDLVTEVPGDRFDLSRFVDEQHLRPGKSYTGAGGFLDDITGFDTGFFSHISPREAEWLDPQQRILLELAVEAVDDAGLAAATLAGSDTAVYVGVSSRDYMDLQTRRTRQSSPYALTGNSAANTANRISHLLDLHGPSTAVDTACSSALTALHEACEQLRNGCSRLALAGGINILISPYAYAGFSAAYMLSPTGRCRSFSAQADGYVRAEGGGLLLLKRLSDAITDGDRVHAVILASGTNSDGMTPGLAVPDQNAQQNLLGQVYERAAVSPDELAYLEAHGTGTRVGDPIECRAIGAALSTHRTQGELLIGSVKSNLGHLEAASGVAGLLKAILVLREHAVPATLNAEPLNPDIDFAQLKLRPALDLTPLSAPPQAVGVNSFGFGGANAHVLLGPAPQPSEQSDQHGNRDELPMVVSARTPTALGAAATQLADHLEDSRHDRPFYDTAYTAALRRGHHPRRAVVLGDGPHQAAQALRALADGRAHPASAVAEQVRTGKVAFIFSGNGSQWAGMGADLLKTTPIFRDAVEQADAALAPHLGWSVQELLAGPPEAQRLAATEVAQPLLFAVQIALVALLDSYGLRPDAVTGHSAGESTAAHVAGALTLADAAAVVATRSQLQATTAGAGRMATISVSEERIRAELRSFEGLLEVAVINGDSHVVVAGAPHALDELGQRMRGHSFRLLDLDYAFHSRVMDPLAEPLRTALAHLRPDETTLAMVSSVTGALTDGRALDAEHWVRNVRQPVRFADAVHTLRAQGCDVFVEVGPHPVLCGYLRRLTVSQSDPVAVIPTCQRERAGGGGLAEVRTAVAHAVAAGAGIDWERYFPRPGRVVDLPGYPWQRERHWRGEPSWWNSTTEEEASDGQVHPMLGTRLTELEPVWAGPLEVTRVPWLADHRVGASVLLPGTAYAELALAAGRRLFEAPVELDYLDITQALVLPEDDESEVWLQTSYSEGDQQLRIASRTGEHGPWRIHARGRVRRLLAPTPSDLDIAAARDRCDQRWESSEHYTRAAHAGLPYGPSFQVLQTLHIGKGEVLASYASALSGEGYQAHPVIMDGALQTGLALLAGFGDAIPFLPTGIERVRLWRAPTTEGVAYVVAREIGAHEACWDVTITDHDGQVSMELVGCRVRRWAGEDLSGPPVRYLEPVLRAAPGPDLEATPAPALRPAVLRDASTRHWQEPIAEGTAADGFVTSLKDFSAHFAARAMATLTSRDDEFTVADLIAHGMRPQYEPLAPHLLALATRFGLAKQTGTGRWRLTATPQPEARLRAAIDRHPAHAMVAILYARCGLHLPAVLRGEKDAQDLMFAEQDQHLVEHFYSHFPPLSDNHQHTAAAVRALVTRWPTNRPLRILEVGAGTGATTAVLLPLLPPERTSYLFTDVSPTFLTRAQARFAAYDFVDYHLLDLDTNPSEQGFDDRTYDLVIASNALHTTSDLRRTLGYIHRLLAANGLLLAVESHDTAQLAPCFGLLDSFWSHTDRELRPDSPLLLLDAWQRLLADCGFTDTLRLNDDTMASDQSAVGNQSVLLAVRGDIDPPAPQPLPSSASDHWLILAERPTAPLTRALATSLSQASGRDVPVAEPDGTAGLWSSRLPSDTRAPHLVLLLDEPTPQRPQDTFDQAMRRMADVRALAVDCQALPTTVSPALSLVTLPTGALSAPETPQAIGDAIAWGACRTLANEQPKVTVRRLSLQHGTDPATDARRLARELLRRDTEAEVLLTPEGRFHSRILHHTPRPRHIAPNPGPCVLRVQTPGIHHRLHWQALAEALPGPGEVAIAVRAAALNYRDVMMAVGTYPPGGESITEDGIALGLECAGTITAVGPGVTSLTIGQRVYASSHHCLSTHVIARADQTGRIPDAMTYTQAATLPAVFFTVQHSLDRLAHLQPGETLLVHSAAGGVGLAALQLAQHRGSHVIATAGTPAKRDMLHMLGADHVLDSRTLDFAHQVSELTNGQGVDVVLNSLAGEAIPRTLELLRPKGRFVELGKQDIYQATPLLLRPFRNNLAFFGVDAHQLLANPSHNTEFAEMANHITAGHYRPLPHQTYPAERVTEAFHAMRRSRHLGKVVITFDTAPRPDRPEPITPKDKSDGTVLVTGGFGGLGAATAIHLAQRGTKHLALAGRAGAHTPGADQLLQQLKALGAKVTTHSTDITDPAQVHALVEEINASRHPLHGIVHAAMVLKDAPLPQLSQRDLREVLAPKLLGSLLLDEATRGSELDFFVLYSSGASAVGNVQQAPYSAANLFLEALVRARQAAGQPGLALAYGPISDVGYVAREHLTDSMAQRGWYAITSHEALTALHRLHGDRAPVVLIERSDWEKLHQMMPTVDTPRFAALLLPETASQATADPDELRRKLDNVTPDEAHRLVSNILADVIATVLHHPAQNLDHARPLNELGVDSLMATELTVALRRRTGLDFPSLEIVNGGGVSALAHRVLVRLGQTPAVSAS
ncbi:SDR family NAD(P)-dependent oxidoreductase [Streptomyces sp. XH2]|uniref:SDR family NAD(P)-dependent oxidoreductase n=1 Tax=Streptomyces sp. XH2 TaxID=3412483 RepID=UPI003C7DEBFD